MALQHDTSPIDNRKHVASGQSLRGRGLLKLSQDRLNFRLKFFAIFMKICMIFTVGMRSSTLLLDKIKVRTMGGISHLIRHLGGGTALQKDFGLPIRPHCLFTPLNTKLVKNS